MTAPTPEVDVVQVLAEAIERQYDAASAFDPAMKPAPLDLARVLAEALADRLAQAQAPTEHVLHVTARPVAEDAVWCEPCEEWVMSIETTDAWKYADQAPTDAGQRDTQERAEVNDDGPHFPAEIRAEALREAATELFCDTEGPERKGTARWPEHDRDIYSLAIGEAQFALFDRANRISPEQEYPRADREART